MYRQDVPAAFSADCQLLVIPFIIHMFSEMYMDLSGLLIAFGSHL